jgi:hypothetical protein
MKKTVFRNEDVERVLMGVPREHRHIRTIVETKDELFVLQEATIAGIVRAYITLKTHPTLDGVELVTRACEDRKRGYAKHQLLESERVSAEVISELSRVL